MGLAKNIWRKATKWVLVLVIILCVYLCLGLGLHYWGHRGVREADGLMNMTGAISVYICTHEGAFPGSFQDLVDSDIVRPEDEGWFYVREEAMANVPGVDRPVAGMRFRPEDIIVAWGYEYREADTMPLVIHKKLLVRGDGGAMSNTKWLRGHMKQYKKDKKLRPE